MDSKLWNRFNSRFITMHCIIAVVCLQSTHGLDLSQCRKALGMESGDIPDAAITASSTYDEYSLGPKNARVRNEIRGGAWCPKHPNTKGDSYEFLQINLGKMTVITMVEIQGRFGNGQGQEFAEEFFLEYQRKDGGKWTRFKNKNGEERFEGNSNTYSAELRDVTPPIIGKTVRFIPFSRAPRLVCMRVEIYGCKWTEDCGDNEEYYFEPGTCEETCRNVPCIIQKVAGCYCKAGFARNDAGVCINKEDCGCLFEMVDANNKNVVITVDVNERKFMPDCTVRECRNQVMTPIQDMPQCNAVTSECVDTPDGYQCVCREGYTGSDGYSCIPESVNEPANPTENPDQGPQTDGQQLPSQQPGGSQPTRDPQQPPQQTGDVEKDESEKIRTGCKVKNTFSACMSELTMTGSCDMTTELPNGCTISVAQQNEDAYKVLITPPGQEIATRILQHNNGNMFESESCGTVMLEKRDEIKIKTHTCGMCLEFYVKSFLPPPVQPGDPAEPGLCPAN